MRSLVIISSILILSCQSHQPHQRPSDDWLNNYSRQSERTNPGDYSILYDNLPQSLDSICSLIKCQLIHPLEARQMNLQLEEFSQDGSIQTVKDMLEQLIFFDSTGLNYNREIKDRLVVACYHHAMLLASILRYNGIPVRLRAGFSKYYEKQSGIRFGHIICEFWDYELNKWTLVDPDRKIVNLPEKEFDFAYEAWNNINKNKTFASIYTSSISDGVKGIINLMVLDAALIAKEERLYWDLPIIVLSEINGLNDLDDDATLILNELADYCNKPDLNMNELLRIYHTTEYFKSAGIEYESYVEMIMNRE